MLLNVKVTSLSLPIAGQHPGLTALLLATTAFLEMVYTNIPLVKEEKDKRKKYEEQSHVIRSRLCSNMTRSIVQVATINL